MTFHFHVGRIDDATELVRDFHYSRRLPGNIQMVGTWHKAGGLFGDSGDAIAAIFFSIPPTRWSEDVWELSRLVRRPDCQEPLTKLISQSIDFLKKTRPVDLIISFADWTQQHHGGIYQAASWNYAGQREPSNDGLIIDGIFHPGRSLNSKYGTRSKDRLSKRFGDRKIEIHMDLGKHLYWKAVTRLGNQKAARLGFGKLPYPKPGQQG